MIPIRTSTLWCSNAVASCPGDPFNRDLGYVRDPAGWVADWLGKMEGIGGGFMLPGGTIPGAQADVALLFQEAEARDVFLDGVSARRAAGLRTSLYLGSVLPDGSRFDPRAPATRAWMAENLAAYFEAGVTTLFLDGCNPRWSVGYFAAFGLRVGGNAIPYDDAGRVEGRTVPKEKLDVGSLECCPFLCTPKEESGLDIARAWRFDPLTTEAHILHEDWKYATEEESIAEVVARRKQGYVVDASGVPRPKVAACIGAAGRHANEWDGE